MYFSTIFNFACILFLANVAFLKNAVFAEVQTINHRQLTEIVDSTRLVLAHLRSSKECHSKCKENLKLLASMQDTLSIYEIQVVDVYSANMLKPYDTADQPANNRLFFYRAAVPLLYDAADIQSEDLLEFIQQHKDQVYLRTLDDQGFEHQTQASTGSTTGDWFLLFYSPQCDEYISVWETLAAMLAHHKVVATMNTDYSPVTKQRFAVTKCPSAIYLRAGKYYPYDQPMELSKLVLFAEGWFKNAPSHRINPLPTFFDSVLDNVVSLMKQEKKHAFEVLLGISGVIALVVLVFCCRKVFSKPKPKLF